MWHDKWHNIKTHNPPKIMDFPKKYLFNTSVQWVVTTFRFNHIYAVVTVSQITYFERILFDALKMVGQTKQFKVSLLRDTKNLMQYYAYSITSLIFLQLFYWGFDHQWSGSSCYLFNRTVNRDRTNLYRHAMANWDSDTNYDTLSKLPAHE